RWPKGFVCPLCQNSGYCELKSRKLFQCNRCRVIFGFVGIALIRN
ncbi:MAG: transposase, partial [Candidatus Omnitrophica bacterium]|nr:transposase [Candidatus Omnitrophota bacterium]